MKKNYISPETELFVLQGTKHFMDNASIVEVDGNSEVDFAGDDKEGKDADAKEFVFEEDPWQSGASENYWE